MVCPLGLLHSKRSLLLSLGIHSKYSFGLCFGLEVLEFCLFIYLFICLFIGIKIMPNGSQTPTYKLEQSG